MKKEKYGKIYSTILVLGLLCLSFLPVLSGAQTKFPSRPIQFICPWGAGGGTDRVARMLAVEGVADARAMNAILYQPRNARNTRKKCGITGEDARATLRLRPLRFIKRQA